MKNKILTLVFIFISLAALIMTYSQFCKAEVTTGDIHISADGSITGTEQIQRASNTYTLTGDISGKITVEKDNIIIDGSGYTLKSANSSGDGGIVLDNRDNVTVKNLYITDCSVGIGSQFGNCTFEGNELGYCIIGIAVQTYGNNTFRGNVFYSPVSFSNGGGGNYFSRNNFITNGEPYVNQRGAAVGPNFFDFNYYYAPVPILATFYNGTDANGDGIGDTPKVVYNGCVDNHPLMNPVVTSWLPLSSPSTSPTPTLSNSPSPNTSPNPTPMSSTSQSPSPVQTPISTPISSETAEPTSTAESSSTIEPTPSQTLPATLEPTTSPNQNQSLPQETYGVIAFAAAIVIIVAIVLLLKNRLRHKR